MPKHVKVTFNYEPDEPDDEDATGMSAEEHEKLTDTIMELGGDDIKVEVVHDPSPGMEPRRQGR